MAEIFHLVVDSEWRSGVEDGLYRPARFSQDGFVHCASDAETTLAVARSYFGAVSEPIWVLRLDTAKLSSQVRFEAPAPLSGGSEHRTAGKLFPHVYGPLNLDAITGRAQLTRDANGFRWPDTW